MEYLTNKVKAICNGVFHYGSRWSVLGWWQLGSGLHLSHLAGLWVRDCFAVMNIRLANLQKGMEKYEEARAFVVEYHANGDANHPIVELEMAEMIASMREQGILSWRNFFDVRALFRTRSRRYRMMLNIAMSWFGQFSGSISFSLLTNISQGLFQ